MSGVYVILDVNLKILYIGETNLLGRRLSAYFHYATGSDYCTIVDQNEWIGKPEFVATIGVPPETGFEVSAIEEYLISMLKPPNNTLGREWKSYQ